MAQGMDIETYFGFFAKSVFTAIAASVGSQSGKKVTLEGLELVTTNTETTTNDTGNANNHTNTDGTEPRRCRSENINRQCRNTTSSLQPDQRATGCSRSVQRRT